MQSVDQWRNLQIANVSKPYEQISKMWNICTNICVSKIHMSGQYSRLNIKITMDTVWVKFEHNSAILNGNYCPTIEIGWIIAEPSPQLENNYMIIN